MMQGWYYVESLTGQRHDRVQTESQIATVDSCFDLVGSPQYGVASCEVFSWSTDSHKPTICRWWWPQIVQAFKLLKRDALVWKVSKFVWWSSHRELRDSYFMTPSYVYSPTPTYTTSQNVKPLWALTGAGRLRKLKPYWVKILFH